MSKSISETDSKTIGRVCITGANGYIGRHVAAYVCTHREVEKCILADITEPTEATGSARCMAINLLEEAGSADLYDRLGRPDVLIHLAWKDGFNHTAESHLQNVYAHYAFLRNMIDSGVRSVAVMGSMHEVGYHEGAVTADTPCRPLSLYGIGKNTLRQAIMLYAEGKEVSLKWLRAFYITGDDTHNKSIFAKILQMAQEGKTSFPFTDGTSQYDFTDVRTLAEYIAEAAMQSEMSGIINVCSGEPVALKDKVEEFIREHRLSIAPEYGRFPKRKYDSPAIWGDATLIRQIIKSSRAAHE